MSEEAVLVRAGPAPDASRGRLRAVLADESRRNKVVLALVIVAIAVVTSIGAKSFLTWNNWRNLLEQLVVIGILSWGTTLLMVSGGIDLSIGSNVSVTSLLVAVLMTHGTNSIVAIVIAVLAATAVGAVNGVLASYSKAHPFILTLGMLTLLQGVALLISATPVSGLPDGFLNFAFTRVAGIPLTVLIAAALWLACHVALSRTVYGRRLYAIGGAEEAARLAGVRVRSIKVVTYSLVGLMVGIAAVMLTSTLSAGQAYAGQGMEMTAVAAVAVGGTPLRGGRGDVVGTALGVLLIGLITNALNLLSINPNVQFVVIGLIIVIAVMAQRQSSR
jgi:ribose/xylose/arabinose/galactoside ABC-type transport system permease subunit